MLPAHLHTCTDYAVLATPHICTISYIEDVKTELMVDGEHLLLADVALPARDTTTRVTIDEDALRRIRRSRAAVERFLAQGAVVYGITTSFGKFQDRVIPLADVEQLQRNIVLSHAVGTDPLL